MISAINSCFTLVEKFFDMSLNKLSVKYYFILVVLALFIPSALGQVPYSEDTIQQEPDTLTITKKEFSALGSMAFCADSTSCAAAAKVACSQFGYSTVLNYSARENIVMKSDGTLVTQGFFLVTAICKK